MNFTDQKINSAKLVSIIMLLVISLTSLIYFFSLDKKSSSFKKEKSSALASEEVVNNKYETSSIMKDDKKETTPSAHDGNNEIFSSKIPASQNLQNFPTGNLLVLKYQINENTVIDLSSYNYDFMVFLWEGSDFLCSVTDQQNLNPVEREDFGEEVIQNSSGLLPFVSSEIFIKPLGTVTDFEIHLINTDNNSNLNLSAASNYSSGPKYSTLNIIPRENWSSDPNINDPRLNTSGGRLVWEPYYYRINKFVIHHTATQNGEDPINMMKAIYYYHTYSLNLGDIGYNYLIDQYGNIYEGKLGGEEAKGYHAGTNGNPESIGISLLGTFTDEVPTQAARDALTRLMAEKAAFHNINLIWQTTVFAHRDFMATACPGNSFYNILPTLSSQAQNYLNSNFSSLKGITIDTKDISYRNLESYYDYNLKASFNNQNDLNSFINSQIPIDPNTSKPAFWTGIKGYSVNGNEVVFQINYSNETGSYYSLDRFHNLYKIFQLDPRVDIAGVDSKYYLSD